MQGSFFLAGGFALSLLAMAGSAKAASFVTVGTAPIAHPSSGRDASFLSLTFPPGWWDTRHEGTMEGSGFTWTYDPVAFGPGFSRTFEIGNISRPRMTKVLTLTLVVREVFMGSPGTKYCELQYCGNYRDFWSGVYSVTGPPWILAGASNLGYNPIDRVWTGQVQFRVRPQPAAEYITFQDTEFPAMVSDIVSMTLEITCVPETSTWAMMIAGFGAVGVAARRRRGAGRPADLPRT